MEDSIFRNVMRAQLSAEDFLLRRANVVGTAVGYKDEPGSEPAIIVLVEQKLPLAALSADDLVPDEVDGVRTDVVEVGFLQAYQTPKDRFRPIPGGVSIGHYKVTAGTFGALVYDRATGAPLILSNNHVLANSNEALQGDPILQPAAMDGGREPGDVVATLERWIALHYLEGPVGPPAPAPDPVEPAPPDPVPGPAPDPVPGPAPRPTPEPQGCDFVDVLVGLSNLIASLSGSQKRAMLTTVQAMAEAEAARARPGSGGGATAQTAAGVPMPEPVAAPAEPAFTAQTGINTVDAAVARPAAGITLLDDIVGIGRISGVRSPELGMPLRKHGRTTGFTEGTVTLLNATVNVSYITSQGRRTARFSGQVLTTPMSQGGDSGSLIVHSNQNQAVGLLFAGSQQATIFTPINLVLDALNVRF